MPIPAPGPEEKWLAGMDEPQRVAVPSERPLFLLENSRGNRAWCEAIHRGDWGGIAGSPTHSG
jgi:hypothetical protein